MTERAMGHRRDDGLDASRRLVWVFVLVYHYTDEAFAHVAKVGNRFAALQPV